MLLSTVFELRPLAENTLPLTQGNAIHAWFLHLVRQQEPQLPVFSANNPPAPAHETGRKSLPGAVLRAGEGG